MKLFLSVALLCAVILASVLLGPPNLQAQEGDTKSLLTASSVQPYGLPVINVPGGDVEALYQAVYENGEPRDNVDIVLGAGVFQLDPGNPYAANGGRLILGTKTVLRSSLEMEVDENGVPVVDGDGNPNILNGGAIIDGTNVIPGTPFGPFHNGVILVGDKGTVEKLQVDQGNMPGIEIIYKGTVRHVLSTNHPSGIRVRSPEGTGFKVNGLVENSLFTGNYIAGIITFAGSGTSFQTSNADIKATFNRNASVNSGNYNMLIVGAFGNNDNKLSVNASYNVFSGSLRGAMRVVGGESIFSPASRNNTVKVKMNNNRYAETDIGVTVEGGSMVTFTEPPLNDNNQATVTLSNPVFENILTTDIVVYGSFSFTGDFAGDNNEAKVKIKGVDESEVSVATFDCFPAEAFPTCTNEAEVTFTGN